MVKLCIFDLDGTVLDTVGTIAHYGNYALEKHGIEPIPSCEYKYLAGTGASNLIKNMLRFRQCYCDELYEKVYRDYNAAYNADVTYQTTIFEGLKEVLDSLKAKGCLLAVASNKPDFAARTVVRALYGEDYFVYVTGQTPGGPLKPDPAMVLEILNRLDIKKEECLYIGDTSTDMLTGKNAGLFTVGVLWGFRDKEELLESGADAIIAHPDALFILAGSRNQG